MPRETFTRDVGSVQLIWRFASVGWRLCRLGVLNAFAFKPLIKFILSLKFLFHFALSFREGVLILCDLIFSSMSLNKWIMVQFSQNF